MALVPVADALSMILDGAAPGTSEAVELHAGDGRVLSAALTARRTQPPFPASAMDGYAVRAADIAQTPVVLELLGESAAGRGFEGNVGSGQAARIFTGAPVPSGADTVVIQENTRTAGENRIEIVETAVLGRNIRKAGLDFVDGDILLDANRVLDPAALSLAAAGNYPSVNVWKKPLVALIATGDELVSPGSALGSDQIISSNAYGVGAICRMNGADVLDLGIAPDRLDAIEAMIARAVEAQADVIVTLGGASVGDHDLVHKALSAMGMTPGFWKIAMRPGKPLMFGRLGAARCLGLPGNPVSSLICSHLFLKPLVRALAGLPVISGETEAILGVDMGENDNRQDYVRASLATIDGDRIVTPFKKQDSSMLKTLADANAAIIRPPFAGPAKAGDVCSVLLLR